MKVAISSQNRHSVTGHAGKCRKFWIYELDSADRVTGKTLLELPMEQALHNSPGHAPHPLDEVQGLVSGGMGEGMKRRLGAKGIIAFVTEQTDLDAALADFLANKPSLPKRDALPPQGARILPIRAG